MEIAPCKDCPDRTLGCHTECSKYAEFRAEVERVKKYRQEQVTPLRQLLALKVEHMERIRKAHRGRDKT